MESRSRLVTTNGGSIFRVAKLDWQFIGNIRLRGVTPSLRVSGDQQKSPFLPLSLYPTISCRILVPPCRLHAAREFPRSRCVACVETSPEMGIEWLASRLESLVECNLERR